MQTERQKNAQGHLEVLGSWRVREMTVDRKVHVWGVVAVLRVAGCKMALVIIWLIAHSVHFVGLEFSVSWLQFIMNYIGILGTIWGISRESHMLSCLKAAISLNNIENNPMQNIYNLSIDLKSDTTQIRAVWSFLNATKYHFVWKLWRSGEQRHRNSVVSAVKSFIPNDVESSIKDSESSYHFVTKKETRLVRKVRDTMWPLYKH